MKKTIFILFLLFFSINFLSAQFFSSNRLGQITGDYSTGSDFVLCKENGVYTLTEKNVELWSMTETEEGNLRTVIYTYPKDGQKISYQYRNNLLVKIHTSLTDTSFTDTAYNYSDGHLCFSTYSENGILIEAEYYYRSLSDNSLSAVKRYELTSIIGNRYIFENSILLKEVNDSLILSEDFNVTEDGMIQIDKNGILCTYDAAGLLVSEKTNETEIFYSYDGDGKLSRSFSSSSDLTIEKIFDKAVLLSETIVRNGVISEITVLSDEGKKRTLFNKGIPVADVVYQSDNRTIERIDYY